MTITFSNGLTAEINSKEFEQVIRSIVIDAINEYECENKRKVDIEELIIRG